MPVRVWVERDVEDTPVERLASVPERAGVVGAALVLGAIGWLAVVGIGSRGFTRVPWWAVAVVAALHLLALATRSSAAVHATLLCTLAGLAALTRGFSVHPFPLVGALFAYGILVASSPTLRGPADWWHSGAWGRGTARLTLAIGLLPLAGVPLWRVLEGPHLGPGATILGELPLWILPVVGLFVALVTALVEEVAFRGVLLDSAWSAVGLRAGLVVQAAAFGLVHAGSVLGGPWGIVLSGLYGYALGVLRVRTRGLAAPFLAHLLADLVLFGWLIAWTP